MNPHRVLGAIFSAGVTMTLLVGTASAQLDTRFGTNGVVRIPVENGFSNAYAAAVQPDGKVVLAGQGNTSSYYDHDFLVARLNADGTPDRSFGTGGKVTRGVRSEDAFHAVAVQSDGKIVAAGTSDDVQICGLAPTGGCGHGRLVVMRFLPDGTPDRAWGNDGFVEVAQLPQPNQDVIAKEISLLPDGAVLVYGQTGYGPVAVRLLANGAVDTTFGQSGYARLPYTPTDYGGLFLGSLPERGLLLERRAATGQWFSWWDPASGTETAFARPAAFSQCPATGSSYYGRTIARADDRGRMIVARLAADMNLLITDGWVCLTRILSSGETDATFGAGGTLVVPVAGIDWRSDLGITPWQGGIAIGVKAQPDANLPDVFRRNRFTAVLVDESGAIRTATGDSGRVSLTIPGEAVTLSGIVAGASRLFLFGAGGIPTPVLAVAAMDDTGPVASFASGGFAKFDALPMRGASLSALAAQGSDRIVAVGSAAGYGLAARFHLDGRLDTTFGEQGLSYFRLGDGSDSQSYSGASAVAALPDGRLLVAGWGWVPRDTNHYSGIGMSVARLLPDGRQDFTFGNGGWNAGCLACRGTGTSEPASAIRVLADGSVLLAGGGGNVGVTAKFTAEGLPDASYVLSRNPYGFPVDEAQLLSSSGALSVAGTLSSLAGTSFAVATVSPSGAWGPLTQLPGPSSREVAAGTRLQSDARLLLAGTSGYPATSLAVKRTLPVVPAAGTTLDPTFGIGGTALLTLPGFNTSGASVEVDGAGHVIATGAAIGVADTSDRALLVARFLANGALDAAFGSQGYLRLPLPVARGTIAPALLRQRDDGFIVGNGTDEGLFLARVASSQPANVADLDGDGMPDALERGLGFDPFVRDNDLFSPGLGSAYLFAMQQYRDFLGREADDGGLRGWAEAVANGSYTRAQVIDAFLSSEEFAGAMAPVVRLYFATFLRTPDHDGLMFNAGLVRDGTISLAQLADYFAASPEFAAHYGALGNAQFVTLLYANILGRAPDAAGLAAWTALLDAGAYTRGQVLLGFSESAEMRASIASEVLVTMMYAGMLRRSPDAAGFGGWVSLLDGGMARTQVIDGFFLSSEYRARFLP